MPDYIREAEIGTGVNLAESFKGCALIMHHIDGFTYVSTVSVNKKELIRAFSSADTFNVTCRNLGIEIPDTPKIYEVSKSQLEAAHREARLRARDDNSFHGTAIAIKNLKNYMR